MKKKLDVEEETLVYVYKCFGLIYPSSIEQQMAGGVFFN